jgi:hypothetical protein
VCQVAGRVACRVLRVVRGGGLAQLKLFEHSGSSWPEQAGRVRFQRGQGQERVLQKVRARASLSLSVCVCVSCVSCVSCRVV